MYYKDLTRSIKNYKINTVIKILITSDFLIASSHQLLGPIFAIFVAYQLTNGSLEAVGIAAALFLITKSIFEIPVGIYIDRSKSEKDDLYTAFVGTIIIALVYLLYTTINNVGQLYVIQIVLGIAAAISYPGWYSIFTRHIDKGKEAVEWSLYDVLLGVGMAATAALGGFLAHRFGFNIVFIIVASFTFLGAVSLLIIKNKIYTH